MNEPADIQDRLPLAHLAYQIMLSLAGEDLSAAELSRDIRARTGGALRCAQAEVREMIRKLEQYDYVQESALQPDPENYDDHRRTYTLTLLGMQVASAETLRIARVLPVALERRLVTADQLRGVLPRTSLR